MPIYPPKTVDYDFDNPACYSGSGTTIYDLSGNLDLSIVGSPTYTSSSDFGNYFSFLRSTVVANHIASAFSPIFDGNFNFSMSFCIRLKNFDLLDNYIYGGLNSDTLSAFDAPCIGRLTTGNWYTSVGFNENVTTTPAPDDIWYVVTVTADFTNNQLKTYVNGTLVKTDTCSSPVNFSNAQVILGFINATPYRNTNNLGDSDIKAFSVWKNAVLTGPQVQDVAKDFQQYTNVKLFLDAGNPASYLGSGGTWSDLSPSNITYTMVNPLYSPTEGGYFTFVSPGDGVAPTNYGFKDNLGPITTAQTDITMQAWIRVPAQPGGTIDGITVFTNGNEGAGYGYYQSIQWNYYAFSGRMPGLNITGTAGYFATDVADAFPTDAWTLFTITVDSSNNLKIYYNDTLMETFTGVSMGTAPAVNAQLYIGTNNASPPYPKAFNGDMAVIRFYDTALDATTIQNQYTNEVGRFAAVVSKTIELDATNVSSYSGTGNTWYDLTANNNDVELNGNTTWTNILGVKSFDFDGTNSYAYNASVSVGATNNFTIDSWFKISDTQTNQYIHSLGNPGANTYPLLAYNFPGFSAGVFAEMGGGTAATTIIASPSLDTWYNITMTADGTDVKYYLDGTLQSTVSQGSGAIPTSSIELTIGNHAPGPYNFWLDGNVGYYAVYDGAIGATTVAANYTTNLPKFTPSSPPGYNGNVGGRQFGQGFNG